MVTFDEIQNAFSFVSSDEYGMNRAVLCLDNGEIYYHSEMGDFDELDEDKFDCDNFVEILTRMISTLIKASCSSSQNSICRKSATSSSISSTGAERMDGSRLSGRQGPPAKLVRF